eukprot:TRINITY_DN63_c0_g2_i3.p1 TRINITY_DN63_c0_g2~~TRINITY_DN63_c0_g2_i3.p1  ORF type:complete len:101 (-),score=16.96 TRINITY_DN63_c0_g2_i3:8-310(-)
MSMLVPRLITGFCLATVYLSDSHSHMERASRHRKIFSSSFFFPMCDPELHELLFCSGAPPILHLGTAPPTPRSMVVRNIFFFFLGFFFKGKWFANKVQKL